MGRRNWIAAGVVLLVAASVGAAAEGTGAAALDRAGVEALVKAEVARQVPALVQAEVHKQLGEAIAQAGKNARMQAAASTLVAMRSELELYKIMHNDVWPTLEAMQDWKALRMATDASGAVVPGAKLGPYVKESPVNPFTGRTVVVAAGMATTDAGWTWDEKKGVLRIVMPDTETVAIRTFTLDSAEVAKVHPVAAQPDAVGQMRQQAEALKKNDK